VRAGRGAIDGAPTGDVRPRVGARRGGHRQTRTGPAAPRGPFAARGPRKRYPAVRSRRGRGHPARPGGNAERAAPRRGTGRARTGQVVPEAGRASSVRAEMAAGVRRRVWWCRIACAAPAPAPRGRTPATRSG